LNNSKYSNLYNYCGVPSYLNITINNATNQTINNQTLKNETKIEIVKNETNNTINNQTVKNETKIEIVKNETNNTINNQTIKNESIIEIVKNETNNTINNQTVKNESIIEIVKNETNNTINNQTVKNESINEIFIKETNNTRIYNLDIGGIVTQKENQSFQNSTKETGKVEIIENNPNKNQLNNNDTLVNQNLTSRKNQGKNFVQKSLNYLAQKDKNFYIIVICVFVVILELIGFAICIFICRKKRKKRYIKFKETAPQNANPNNISVVSSNDSEIKNEPQSNA
jgi:hypothetical protein